MMNTVYGSDTNKEVTATTEKVAASAIQLGVELYEYMVGNTITKSIDSGLTEHIAAAIANELSLG